MIDGVLRLEASWERLEKTDKPVILYGTGNGADKVIDELERNGIRLSGVMASDGFVRSRVFRGFEVNPVSFFEEKYGDFIIIVGFGTNREDVIENIIGLSKRHTLIVPCVPVCGNEIFNREFILKHSSELEEAYSLLSDERSKQVFEDFLKFELTGELEYLFNSEADKDEVFNNILKLSEKENYLDLGAYRGDTVDEFLRYADGKYSSITALEPNKKSYKKLTENTRHLQNCRALNMGVWSERTELCFNNDLGRGSSAREGVGQAVISVDGLRIQTGIAFSYIKADVEGSEGKMLEGAKQTLRLYRPKLNIAAYHSSEDIFTLPIMIKRVNPDYRIYLRHHRYIPCWDLNYYCV